jgi:hypothetical protein
MAFAGAGVEFKYRFLDRQRAPFGLTLGVEPHWGRVDEETAAPVQAYGLDISLAADKELVADRIYAAFNLAYDGGSTRYHATGEWGRDSGLVVAAALTSQLYRGVFFGFETRYLTRYEGIALGTLVGEALYVGPTFYAAFPGNWSMSLAWNVQVAGHAKADPASFDLTDFERNQLFVRIGKGF